ncbi:phosphoesterase, partial [Acinetobacter baumannii]
DALMGNHELNAIAYATERPKGGHYRPHSLGNESQHEAFLQAFEPGSRAYGDAINFMRSLAICYRDDAIQAVHAAWITIDI